MCSLSSRFHNEDIRNCLGSTARFSLHRRAALAAGAISIGALKDAPVEDLDWQYRVNVRAPYQLTQALLPMIRSGRGQIVFVNSLVGLNAKAGSSQYSMAKHALKALADSLRRK